MSITDVEGEWGDRHRARRQLKISGDCHCSASPVVHVHSIGDLVVTEVGDKALDKQIGGNHYKDFVIQPVDFIHKNGIGFLEGNVIKYTCRHNKKNGKDDLLKAKHYIELLLELEYGD